MAYIDYLNGFNQWLESGTLPIHSQLLYFKLLNVFNRAGWPEYVQVDNLRLMIMAGVTTEKTVIRARDALIDAGFISYQKGRKGVPGKYALNKIHCNYYSVSDSVSDSISDSINDSISDSTNDSHIKTKNKTKNKTKINKKRKIEKEKNIIPPDGENNYAVEATSVCTFFTPPTVEEVRTYCMERGNLVDPEQFVDFYTSKGWKVGNQRMKDWKAAVRTWERNGNHQINRKTKKVTADNYTAPLGDGDIDLLEKILLKSEE